VVCFKKHKERPCTSTKRTYTPKQFNYEQQQSKDEDTYQVSQKEFDLLAMTPEITNALKDSRLQELIKNIDKYHYPRIKKQKLEQTIKNIPEFNTFVDTMLKTIFIRDENGQCMLYNE